MGVFNRIFSHFGSGSSSGGYYSSMNNALLRLNNVYTMLHYPLFRSEQDSFLDAQTNLTDYCMSLLPSIQGKRLLEVGCGNGVQANYILERYTPDHLKAIDLNAGNIEIARQEAKVRGDERVEFCVDDAHSLNTVADNSVDFLINIESAFHYPQKIEFLKQIHRVLKPGGSYVIADILTTKIKENRLKNFWKKRMSFYHWPLESYQRELPGANLGTFAFSDITSEVIRGFGCYKRWLREMEKRHFLEDLALKIYYTIHVRLNIYLLRTRRQYCVIVGNKPEGVL
ncbi:MAG: class I SAM-dependent methyltransferase [Bacteroidales bacterium]